MHITLIEKKVGVFHLFERTSKNCNRKINRKQILRYAITGHVCLRMRKIQSCRNPVLQMLGQEKALTRNLSRLSRVSSNRRSLLLPGERCPASPDAFYTTNSARLANDLFGSVSGPKLPQEAGAEAPSAAQTDLERLY